MRSVGADTRQALAPRMNHLMGKGRYYPNCQRYGLGAAHKDDPTWEFDLGLDRILDGIAARLGSESCCRRHDETPALLDGGGPGFRVAGRVRLRDGA
ncbi:hypothetical protein DXZ75_37670 [Streptomyces sp. AcE210]|nr:hypothetical protein DXZ75_37670 [Streptomyces sp. AcE210]